MTELKDAGNTQDIIAIDHHSRTTSKPDRRLADRRTLKRAEKNDKRAESDRRSPTGRRVSEIIAEGRSIVERLEEQVANGEITSAQRNEILARSYAALSVSSERSSASAKEFKEIADKDPLTGAYTRKAFWEKAKLLLREENETGAIMLDLDHFKKVNDNYGHPFGDTVLKSAVEIIISSLRENRDQENQKDSVYRFGGEEFLVILPGIKSFENLEMVSERIRNAIASKVFVFDDPKKIKAATVVPITTSIGGKMFSGDDIDRFIGDIDSALYEAKAKGRNQTVITK